MGAWRFLPQWLAGPADGPGDHHVLLRRLGVGGITAAEAEEPRKVIPKAINQVIWRILIFYIGALSVLLMLYPWDQLLETLGAAGLSLQRQSVRADLLADWQ